MKCKKTKDALNRVVKINFDLKKKKKLNIANLNLCASIQFFLIITNNFYVKQISLFIFSIKFFFF